MRLLAYVFFAVAIVPQTFATAGDGKVAAGSEKALTNGDIVALVRAGFGDDVVIAKIRQAKIREVDLSTQALIQLKEVGVSSFVIAALVTAEASPSGTVTPASKTNAAFDARAPLEEVIDDNTMLLEANDGARRVKLTTGQFHKVGIMGAGATFMVYPGAKASVRTTDRRPVLTFVHETSPAEYVFFVKTESDPEDNDRSVKIGSFFRRGAGFTSKNNGKPDPDWTVAYDVSEDPSQVWHVRPKVDLQPGEYALYYMSGIWAFGVD
jgi:hypothetical protein